MSAFKSARAMFSEFETFPRIIYAFNKSLSLRFSHPKKQSPSSTAKYNRDTALVDVNYPSMILLSKSCGYYESIPRGDRLLSPPTIPTISHTLYAGTSFMGSSLGSEHF